MDILNFKSSSTGQLPGSVFQDSFFRFHDGETDAPSSFSDTPYCILKRKAPEQVNGRYVAMVTCESNSQHFSEDNDFRSHNQPPKWTTGPVMQSYDNGYQDQDSGRGDKSPGFLHPPTELTKALCESAKGVYRLSYNPPIPKRNLMVWNESDIELLNQFTNSTVSNHSSATNHDDAHKRHLRDTTGGESRKIVLLDLKTLEDENSASQTSESLLTYDPRWTFDGESAVKHEIPRNICDVIAKELNEGLHIDTDSKYRRSLHADKFSANEAAINSSSSCFPKPDPYFRGGQQKLLENMDHFSVDDRSSDDVESQLDCREYKGNSCQKYKTAKGQPIIKSIAELLADPYENSECVFCKGNDQTEEVYLSHPIRIDNIVVCPYLRKYVCAICKATGDASHTIKYCPFNKRGFFAMREKFPPPNKSFRPLVQDSSISTLKKGKIAQSIWKSKSRKFDSNGHIHNDQSLYSSNSSLASTASTNSSCYSDIICNNRLFFQNLAQLRKNPKTQDIGCRST